MSWALQQVPGLRSTPDGRGGRAILGRSIVGGWCEVLTILDGMPLPDGDVNFWVDWRRVTGIEVYPNGALAPPKYVSANYLGGCSIVLIWTQ